MNYGLFPGFPLQALANISHGCAVFTSAESGKEFVVPDGVSELFVLLVGGGGGGGNGTTSRGGMGGQSGEVLSRRVDVLPGQQIVVTIGGGGAAASNGGASSFGSLLTASGGVGGLTSVSDVPGMAGGAGLSQSGTYRHSNGVGTAGQPFGGGGSGGYGIFGGGVGAAGGCWVFW